MRVPQDQFAAMLLNPLPHASYAHTYAAIAKLRDFIRHAYAIISDCSGDLALSFFQRNECLGRPRMPENIRQRLLNDTE
jgi:hypothetical protein